MWPRRPENTSPVVDVAMWRHYDPEARTIPGMSLGRMWAGADAVSEARDLYERGARMVELAEPVDLRTDHSTAALTLIRELTGRGIVVAWSLASDPEHRLPGTLSHLYPPSAIQDHPGGENVVHAWRAEFFIGKCVYRHGPGFIQVRDHRAGHLECFTIDDPRYLSTIDGLLHRGRAPDTPSAEELSGEILESLAAEALVLRFGSQWWWAPYRAYRWPQPSHQV